MRTLLNPLRAGLALFAVLFSASFLSAQDADPKPAAQTPTASASPDADAKTKSINALRRMISWDKGAASPTNPKNLVWEFTAGGIADTEKGQLVAFRPTIYGAPINNSYDVVLWDLDKEPGIAYHEVWINRLGVIFTSRIPDEGQNSGGGSGSVGFRLGGAKGEPHRYLLLSPDRKLAVYGTIVPFPNIVHTGKCTAELRLASKDAKYLLLKGEGFPANGSIHMQTISAAHTNEQDLKIDDKGKFITGLLVHDGGQPSGTEEINLTSPGCPIHFSQPWGVGSYKRE